MGGASMAGKGMTGLQMLIYSSVNTGIGMFSAGVASLSNEGLKKLGVTPAVARLLSAGLGFGTALMLGSIHNKFWDKYLANHPNVPKQTRTPEMDYDAKGPMNGSDWDDYFKQKYGAENVSWDSETITDINRLNNTKNFKSGTLKHILEGELNARGNAVGFHYEGMPTQKGKIISGTESLPNSKGVYKAMVEVNGKVKTGNGGYSSFFPKDMTPQQIVDTIDEAYVSKTFEIGSRNTYTGTASNGIQVIMYIDTNGQIISAFPKY